MRVIKKFFSLAALLTGVVLCFPQAGYAENIISLSPSQIEAVLLPNTSVSRSAAISYTEKVATNTFAVTTEVPQECHCAITGDSSFSFGEQLEHSYIFTVSTEESAAPGEYDARINFVPQADDADLGTGVTTIVGLVAKVHIVITNDPYAVMAPVNVADVPDVEGYLTITPKLFPIVFAKPHATVLLRWQIHSEYQGILQSLPFHIESRRYGGSSASHDGTFTEKLSYGALVDYTQQYTVPAVSGVYAVTANVYGVHTRFWVIALTLPISIGAGLALVLIIAGVVLLTKRNRH